MKFETEKKLLKDFNFVSMTDMVMLLLIFFLLSSSYVIQPGIKVRLPKSDSGETTTEKTAITLSITRAGGYYLNEERVSLTALPALLQQKIIRGSQQMIVIKADRDITIQRVIQVMDIAKEVGGERFMIGTERSNE